MLWALLFISPNKIGPSFFKFSSTTATVLMGIAISFDFLFKSPARENQYPVLLILVTALLASLYNRAIHFGKDRHGYWLLVVATTVGEIAIILDAIAFIPLMPLDGWEHWLLSANHLSATALLGSVMLTMIFGHWYLVVPNLSIAPICLLTKVYIASLGFRVLTIILSLIVLIFVQKVSLYLVGFELLIRQGLFFWPRLLFGLVVPVILGGMIWSTLKLKHTQAATGLLYLAVVTLLFGEFFSKFLLFSIRIPL